MDFETGQYKDLAMAAVISMLTLFTAGLATATPQEPTTRNPLVARFQLLGAPASVARDDLALELAARFGRTERGREALHHLVDFELVRREALPKKFMPEQHEIEAQLARIQRQLLSQKIALDAFLKQRGMTRAEFAEYAAISIAHERLVLDALGETKPELATNAVLELWLKEARERIGVVEEPENLPAGVMARIGKGSATTDLSALALGRVLLRTVNAEERERYVRQIALCRILEAEAARRGISVTQAEMVAEVAARKKDVESRGGQSISYDQLLASQGTTPELLERSPVLRAQVIEKRILLKLHPDEDLKATLQKDRTLIEKKHGARRRLGLVFLRATLEPNQLVPRDFLAARKRADEIRAEIEKGKPFDLAAAVYSEDGATKARGGDAGWHHAFEADLPAEVLAEAFATPKGQIGQVVQSKDGVWLVKVTDQEPNQSDEILIERLRRELADQYRETVLKEAKVELVDS